MIRRGISGIKLASAAGLVMAAFVVDILLFELSYSLFGLSLTMMILVIDVPLFAGAAAVVVVRRRSTYLLETPTAVHETEEPSSPDDQVEAFLQEKLQEYEGEKELEKPEVPKKSQMEPTKVSKKDYTKSPEKLKVPAFVCRCGHPHRFVCLNCGLTLEKATKKKGTHWVEWVPDMGALR